MLDHELMVVVEWLSFPASTLPLRPLHPVRPDHVTSEPQSHGETGLSPATCTFRICTPCLPLPYILSRTTVGERRTDRCAGTIIVKDRREFRE